MLRHKYIKFFFCFCAALIMLHGCTKSELASAEKDASLKIRLNAPSYAAELKSVSSAPDSPQEWTTWERAVDGRFLYRVTAFILQGDRLVAHKDLSLQGEPVEAQIDFEANFTHGRYTLMIVANYSSFEAEDGSNGTKKYNGLSGFVNTVQEIIANNTLDNFTQLYTDSFLNYQIASENGVCSRVPQPLTLVKEIELHPGTNVITGELIRTYSRVRIAVENDSDEELMLSSLDFADIFTQSKAYLFEGKGYLNTKTNIDVTSSNAMTPFTGSETEPVVIPAKEISVVFDAYILESSKGNSNENYNYSMDLGYGGQSSYTIKSTTAITKRANLSAGQYIICSRNNNYYLKAGANSVEAQANALTIRQGATVPKEFVWTFDNKNANGTQLGANNYYIGTDAATSTGATSYYMNNPTNSSITLGANKSVYFTVEERQSHLTLKSSGNGTYKYVYLNNGKVHGYNSNGSSAQFKLYPVEAPSSSTVEVPVRTINPATGQAEDVEQISRNDFINAIVKVSYSKNKGHFTFEVRDWYTGGGDVEFN